MRLEPLLPKESNRAFPIPEVLFTKNGSLLSTILRPDPSPTPCHNKQPLVDIKSGTKDTQGLLKAARSDCRRQQDDSIKGEQQPEDGTEHVSRHLEDAIQRAILLAKRDGLITYDDLPKPWQCNQFVIYGYRFSNSKLDCLLSTVRISNQSFNIWSHVFGAILIPLIATWSYRSRDFASKDPLDAWVAIATIVAACLCLLCSATWHTLLCCADQSLLRSCETIDMASISILLTASFIVIQYTTFYSSLFWQRIHIATSLLCGFWGLVIPWNAWFRRPGKAWVRVVYFMSLGIQGVGLPFAQLLCTQGCERTLELYRPVWMIYGPVVSGAMIYATKIPERWYPGRFDYVGSSHNIWHVMVLIGMLRGISAVQELYIMAWEGNAGLAGIVK